MSKLSKLNNHVKWSYKNVKIIISYRNCFITIQGYRRESKWNNKNTAVNYYFVKMNTFMARINNELQKHIIFP